MESLFDKMGPESGKKLMYGGATVLACGALYFMKKALSRQSEEDEDVPETLPQISLPAIVSDVDGVALKSKDPVPGTKESLTKLLSEHKDTGRRVPFTFMTNGGGAFETDKARTMNKILGLKGPKLTGKNMTMC